LTWPRLEARGTPVHGDDDCCAQCDLSVPEGEARRRWWYEPAKNKWKLRKKLQRRKEKNIARDAEQRAVRAAERAARLDESDEQRVRDLDRAAG